MILLVKLAFRNIFRNFRRSLLTFLTISLGVALSILFIGFTIGLEQQSIRLSVNTRLGHVKIYEKGYLDDELSITLDHTITDYDGLLSRLENLDGYRSAAERILFPGSLSDGIDELRLIGVGIDIARENRVFDLESKLVRGEFIKPGEDTMLLSDDIAGLFNVGVGDYLTVIARTKYGAINALDCEIAGIIHVGNPEVDRQNFFIPLDRAQDFLEMNNMITEITVSGASMDTADDLAREISAAVARDSYDIVTWRYMARDLVRLYEIRRRARQTIILILFLMASASVMNTMLMSIFERTTEIGTLMAMGIRRGRVQLLFILEGMFLGALGSFIGCLLGGSVTYYFKYYGLSLAAFGGTEGFGNLPIGSTAYTEMTPLIIIAVFLLGVAIAVVSAAYPAFRGSRLEPADALRYV